MPKVPTIAELQRAFVRLVAELIAFAYCNGYELSFAEAYRPPETAKLYAKNGKGILLSLHCDRLAIDFNLFKNGMWLKNSEDFKPLGEFWEGLAKPGIKTCWGGRFAKGDGNHFSIEYRGRR